MTNIETTPWLSGVAVTPPLGEVGESCRRCGVELAADQRYCINCGERRSEARVDYRELLGTAAATALAPNPAPSAPQPPPREEPRAISPLGAAVAIGLLLLAVLLGAVIGKGGSTDQQPVLVGTGAAPAVAANGALADGWSGGDGWTVQLQSFTTQGANAAAVNQAKSDASKKGASDVGILGSDNYASLDPGAWIIYSGVYSSKAGATKAAKELSGEFPGAKVIEVSVSADSGAGAKKGSAGAAKGGTADPALKDLQNTSPTDYSKKSKKLPNEVGTGGAPPPTDNKAPGGGSEGTVIK